MRILHATTFLQGGAGRVIASLAVAQRRSGHDVRVVADAGGEPGYEHYVEYIDALAAAAVPCDRVHSTFKRDLALNAAAAGALRDALRGWQPDVVHAHAATPAVVARLAGLAGGAAAPVLHTMHGWGTAKTAAQAAADLDILQLGDAIVTPSEASRRGLIELGLAAPMPDVIPYGIDSTIAGEAADRSDLALLDRLGSVSERALCIGTIGERKNQRLIVDALACDELRRATVVFIGDGDPQELLHHAHARGVDDRIAVLGYRPRASRYLPHCRALVLPSRNEGLPLAVLEAFHTGIPTVASRIPELTEALADGDVGYLFEPESAVDLSRALGAAFSVSDRTSQSQRLRAVGESRHSLAGMVSAYEVRLATMVRARNVLVLGR